MKKLLLSFLIPLFFMSCSSDDSQKTIGDQLRAPEYGEDFTLSFAKSGLNEADKVDIQIIEVILEIGRSSRDCGSLGICEARICVPGCKQNASFGKSNMIKGNVITSKESNKYSAEEGYIELLLNNSMDNKFDSKLYIDETIIADDFAIAMEVYELDMSLGNFGGYRIPLNKKL